MTTSISAVAITNGRTGHVAMVAPALDIHGGCGTVTAAPSTRHRLASSDLCATAPENEANARNKKPPASVATINGQRQPRVALTDGAARLAVIAEATAASMRAAARSAAYATSQSGSLERGPAFSA